MFHNMVSQALGVALLRPRHSVSNERMYDLDDDLAKHLDSLERGEHLRDPGDGKDRRSATSSWLRSWLPKRSATEALKLVCGSMLHRAWETYLDDLPVS